MTTINLPYPADQAGDIRDKEAAKVEKQPEKTLVTFKDYHPRPLVLGTGRTLINYADFQL